MTAALLTLALLAAANAPDWFRVVQYTPRATSLRGCSECQGEPDDLCEVRAGAQSRPLEEYAQRPPPEAGRVRLLRSKADPDCAAHAKALFAPRGEIELAAIRMGRAAPPAALIERFAVRSGIAGWPRAPGRRKGAQVAGAVPERTALRTALVCWGSERAWPATDLGPTTACEWWLLPVRADGEPDLAGWSFPLVAQRDSWPEPFPFGDPRWSAAFDRTKALEDALLPPEEPARPETAAPQVAAAAEPAPGRAPPAVARCGAEARQRTALLDRFEQWEHGITGARGSLDRAAFTVDAGAWSGHCRELEVLHSVLEQQLGCAVGEEGRCLGPGGEPPR